ncbi:MAG: dihydropteroate synthase [Actinomycetota bacterium]|nr:dihydropteroate synthase [Actinomycetota bacterium]
MEGHLIKGKGFEIGTAKKTAVMGILNVTPDSFSDGGVYLNLDLAIRAAERMTKDGADIIDIGGESSRPGAEPATLADELTRVTPVIEALSGRLNIPISIDTYKAKVAEEALKAGAVIINDISGLRADERMAGVAAEAKAAVVIMHMLGTPRDMQKDPKYKSVIDEIISFFTERIAFAIKSGIKEDKIIIDPGIGFGKTLEHNLEILRRLDDFKTLGFPVLIGTSRKSFIGTVLGLEVTDRLEGTAATVTYSIVKGADIVRVHDVKEMARVAKMTDVLVGRG